MTDNPSSIAKASLIYTNLMIQETKIITLVINGFRRIKSKNHSDVINDNDEANNNEINRPPQRISLTVKVHSQHN